MRFFPVLSNDTSIPPTCCHVTTMYILPLGSAWPGEETLCFALAEPKLTFALAKELRLDDISCDG
jgi:hypothetical protein